VGFAPGGPNDIIARAYGARLAENFGQPFIVENRTGAGGNLAAEAVARAAPDGYTLTLGSTGPSAVNPALYAKLPFDLVRDLDIVSLVATGKDRKSTRLNSSHDQISYAVFCLKKKKSA